ncbi:hypothetical protein H5410_056644 [Solanum commersonii]|uniref:Uncharacterized protein n=1 Tax=Solanum commersonii TaxID=4109 RepID=A0A9J5WNN9_SOLCO|nr:hypothetical protein H5410_056644 [Solanum commersonii]
MDLNALPQPEDDDEIFGQELEDEPQEPIILPSDERADYVTSAVEISRRAVWAHQMEGEEWLLSSGEFSIVVGDLVISKSAI